MILGLAGFCIAAAALLAAAYLGRGRAPQAAAPGPEVAFLFDGTALVDATPAARRLLDFIPRTGDDMDGLVTFLAPRFPDLARRVTACGEDDTTCLLSPEADARLRLHSHDGRLNITLEDLGASPAEVPERFSEAALVEALRNHRRIADALPVAVWQQDAQDRVTWSNGAYAALAKRLYGTSHDRRPVFAGLDTAPARPGEAQRLTLQLPGEEGVGWFDCHVSRCGDTVTVVALPADRIVAAETSLRDFVQTLTRTFAHLSVGLAIFDRGRALTVFNPALCDLLGLTPEFLIAHPTLAQVLDRLRERQMMPEPKDYKSWRDQMHALETAAADGTYSEIWPMPDGRVIRVIGRPHPDGAVAFLFEDISAEIAATQRYREEVEIGRAVIDGIDEAIVVFSASGRLSQANRAYRALWGLPAARLKPAGRFLDETRRWQDRCAPTPVWGDARDFAASIGERSNWTAEVRLTDGRRLACRFETLPDGATLAGFTPLAGDPAADTPRPLQSIGA